MEKLTDGQLRLFPQTTCADSGSATSSPESESGLTPCGSPDGRTTEKYGPAPVRAHPSRRRARGKARRMSDIYGRFGFDSSPSDDLSLSLANRLAPVTDSLGSTMFDLIWKERRTPSGHWIPALRASAVPTSGSGFSSWPTPQASDMTGGGQAKRCANPERSNDLNDFAMLANWASPQSRDHFPAHTHEYVAAKKAEGHGMQNLNEQAVQLTGWPTVTVNDARNGRNRTAGRTNPESNHHDGLTLPDAVSLAQPTASGGTQPGSSAATESGGQLNAALSRYLMSLPEIWDVCAWRAWEKLSGRSRRKARPAP